MPSSYELVLVVPPAHALYGTHVIDPTPRRHTAKYDCKTIIRTVSIIENSGLWGVQSDEDEEIAEGGVEQSETSDDESMKEKREVKRQRVCSAQRIIDLPFVDEYSSGSDEGAKLGLPNNES